jgi:hypothetical protein
MKYPQIFVAFIMLKVAFGQDLLRRQNDQIPLQLEQMYERGLKYLATSQTEEGCWSEAYGSDPGVVGLAVIAFLAHGEEPNHGPHSSHYKTLIMDISELACIATASPHQLLQKLMAW